MRFRGEVLSEFLRIFLRNIRHILKLRQHIVIKIGQCIAPHLEVEFSISGKRCQWTDLFQKGRFCFAEAVILDKV